MKVYAFPNTLKVVIVEINPGEYEQDGWPLKSEKVEQMIENGMLIEVTP